MCSHHPPPPGTALEQRRLQIMEAAMACFARRGFRQTTMHDISHEAGISVGLIYRYFESKEQVIETMAREHLDDLGRKLEEARRLPTLLEALEKVLWCDQQDHDVAASFVVDLFAESARSQELRGLVRAVHDGLVGSITDLIAASSEAAHLAPGMSPRDAAEAVFHAIHGLMLDEILHLDELTPDLVRTRRSATLRRLFALLFRAADVSPVHAPTPAPSRDAALPLRKA